MNTTTSAKKKTGGSAKKTSGRKGQGGSESGIFANVSEGVETAVEGARGMISGKGIGGIIPVALGSFAIGVAIGITGAIFLPKLSDSEVFANTLESAKSTVRNAVDSLTGGIDTTDESRVS